MPARDPAASANLLSESYREQDHLRTHPDLRSGGRLSVSPEHGLGGGRQIHNSFGQGWTGRRQSAGSQNLPSPQIRETGTPAHVGSSASRGSPFARFTMGRAGDRHAGGVTSDEESSLGVDAAGHDGKGKQRSSGGTPSKRSSLDAPTPEQHPVRHSSTPARVVTTPSLTSDSDSGGVDPMAQQRQSKPKTIRATMTRRTSSKLAGLEDSGDDSASAQRPTPRERDSSSAFSRISVDHLQPHSSATTEHRRGSLDPASNAASSSSGGNGDAGGSLLQHASVASGSPNTLPDAIRESTNRLAAMGSFSSNELVEELRKRQGKASEAKQMLETSEALSSDKLDLSPSPTNRPSGLSRMLSRNQPQQQASMDSSSENPQGVSPPEDNDQTPRAPALSLATSYSTSSGTLNVMRKHQRKDMSMTSSMSVESSPTSSRPPTVPQSPELPLAPPSPGPRKVSVDVDERTPLLGIGTSERSSLEEGKVRKLAGSPVPQGARWDQAKSKVSDAIASVRKSTWQDVLRATVIEPASNVPAVILGSLLNVLDGVSYGMILFPASPVFPDFGSIGVSMFFMACIVSQLTFSLGGSIFKGGNGSMMIEAVPFFHILVNIIQDTVGDDPKAIVSTTIFSFAFSSILTGLVFFALGAFKLGALIGYFPRHILVGCIGGVGVFLIETGLEVSLGLKEEGFEYTLNTLKLFFADGHAIALWTVPLALAIILRVITHRFTHQLIFPTYFFLIPCIFYIVIAIGRWPIEHLRVTGWIFDVGKASKPWWSFYTLFSLRDFSWKAFWACIPTQLALVFFGILHVPLNVPALGVSLQEDNVHLDRELIAHGVANIACGGVGTVPSYLCYVNSVLFYRVGGGSRLSGIMLSAATAAIMFIGPSVIGYLPVCVVGALIFVLGIDLVKEAVWDTRYRVNRMEYFTIWVITIGMTIFDFVLGLVLGVILASLFFVIQNSRRKPIRATFNGSQAKSTVRRPHAQRAFIQSIGKQTIVIKLQGFLFFGTITKVEDEIRNLLEVAAWEENPIRFLIVDFALVAGLDFSSAEAFVRIQRLLSHKEVLLIFCGANPESRVGRALQAVDLWADQEGSSVEVFDGLNSALEWTENAYLTAFYMGSSTDTTQDQQAIDFPQVKAPPFALSEDQHHSPRRAHLAEAGGSTLDLTAVSRVPSYQELPQAVSLDQPFPTLLQTFSVYSDDKPEFFAEVAPYFEPNPVETGDVLWRQDDAPDGLFLIESGSLRATYQYEDHTEFVHETMVAGTVAGELSALSGVPRNCTVVPERDSMLWKLSAASLERMEKEKPEAARKFVKMVLKVAAEEVDVLSSHLIAVLS